METTHLTRSPVSDQAILRSAAHELACRMARLRARIDEGRSSGDAEEAVRAQMEGVERALERVGVAYFEAHCEPEGLRPLGDPGRSRARPL